MKESKIAVCIISYQRPSLTTRCIMSVRATIKQPYLIFLVDNGSPDAETRTLLDRMESADDVTLIRLEKNLGPAAGRNAALASMRTEFRFVAMLDNDMVALPGWDIAAINAFERGTDLIQPKLLTGNGDIVERGPNRPRSEIISANPEFIGKGLTKDHPDVSQEEDVAIVGAGIFRREVFETVGGYDERLHIGEDFDLSFRARTAGFTLRYVPNCEMIHDHRFEIDYDQERAKLSKYLTSHVILWQKHKKVLLSPAFLRWYSWLHFHNEPMYMSQTRSIASLPRRLRRRAMRDWIMARYPATWESVDVAAKEATALGEKLGIEV